MTGPSQSGSGPQRPFETHTGPSTSTQAQQAPVRRDTDVDGTGQHTDVLQRTMAKIKALKAIRGDKSPTPEFTFANIPQQTGDFKQDGREGEIESEVEGTRRISSQDIESAERAVFMAREALQPKKDSRRASSERAKANVPGEDVHIEGGMSSQDIRAAEKAVLMMRNVLQRKEKNRISSESTRREESGDTEHMSVDEIKRAERAVVMMRKALSRKREKKGSSSGAKGEEMDSNEVRAAEKAVVMMRRVLERRNKEKLPQKEKEFRLDESDNAYSDNSDSEKDMSKSRDMNEEMETEPNDEPPQTAEPPKSRTDHTCAIDHSPRVLKRRRRKRPSHLLDAEPKVPAYVAEHAHHSKSVYNASLQTDAEKADFSQQMEENKGLLNTLSGRAFSMRYQDERVFGLMSSYINAAHYAHRRMNETHGIPETLGGPRYAPGPATGDRHELYEPKEFAGKVRTHPKEKENREPSQRGIYVEKKYLSKDAKKSPAREMSFLSQSSAETDVSYVSASTASTDCMPKYAARIRAEAEKRREEKSKSRWKENNSSAAVTSQPERKSPSRNASPASIEGQAKSVQKGEAAVTNQEPSGNDLAKELHKFSRYIEEYESARWEGKLKATKGKKSDGILMGTRGGGAVRSNPESKAKATLRSAQAPKNNESKGVPGSGKVPSALEKRALQRAQKRSLPGPPPKVRPTLSKKHARSASPKRESPSRPARSALLPRDSRSVDTHRSSSPHRGRVHNEKRPATVHRHSASPRRAPRSQSADSYSDCSSVSTTLLSSDSSFDEETHSPPAARGQYKFDLSTDEGVSRAKSIILRQELERMELTRKDLDRDVRQDILSAAGMLPNQPARKSVAVGTEGAHVTDQEAKDWNHGRTPIIRHDDVITGQQMGETVIPRDVSAPKPVAPVAEKRSTSAGANHAVQENLGPTSATTETNFNTLKSIHRMYHQQKLSRPGVFRFKGQTTSNQQKATPAPEPTALSEALGDAAAEKMKEESARLDRLEKAVHSLVISMGTALRCTLDHEQGEVANDPKRHSDDFDKSEKNSVGTQSPDMGYAKGSKSTPESTESDGEEDQADDEEDGPLVSKAALKFLIDALAFEAEPKNGEKRKAGEEGIDFSPSSRHGNGFGGLSTANIEYRFYLLLRKTDDEWNAITQRIHSRAQHSRFSVDKRVLRVLRRDPGRWAKILTRLVEQVKMSSRSKRGRDAQGSRNGSPDISTRSPLKRNRTDPEDIRGTESAAIRASFEDDDDVVHSPPPKNRVVRVVFADENDHLTVHALSPPSHRNTKHARSQWTTSVDDIPAPSQYNNMEASSIPAVQGKSSESTTKKAWSGKSPLGRKSRKGSYSRNRSKSSPSPAPRRPVTLDDIYGELALLTSHDDDVTMGECAANFEFQHVHQDTPDYGRTVSQESSALTFEEAFSDAESESHDLSGPLTPRGQHTMGIQQAFGIDQCRGRLVRDDASQEVQDQAAQRVQAHYRGYATRKADVLQVKRAEREEREKAATAVQSLVRGALLRKDIMEKKEATKAIQKVARGYIHRRSPVHERYIKQKEAIPVLQRAARGHLARQMHRRKSVERYAEVAVKDLTVDILRDADVKNMQTHLKSFIGELPAGVDQPTDNGAGVQGDDSGAVAEPDMEPVEGDGTDIVEDHTDQVSTAESKASSAMPTTGFGLHYDVNPGGRASDESRRGMQDDRSSRGSARDGGDSASGFGLASMQEPEPQPPPPPREDRPHPPPDSSMPSSSRDSTHATRAQSTQPTNQKQAPELQRRLSTRKRLTQPVTRAISGIIFGKKRGSTGSESKQKPPRHPGPGRKAPARPAPGTTRR